MNPIQISTSCFATLFFPFFLLADVELASPFASNMVLQRDVENPVWGWSDAGDEVTVYARDQKLSAAADENGKWKVVLQPMGIGKPFSIRIKGSHNEIELKNVVVGEVWICSGQSNMEWTVNASGNPEVERNNADYPMIRHLNVQRAVSMSPQEKCETTGWKICSPETAGEFTAVGYYFGRKLHQELKVPIGLINTTWGGTIVEAWTSADSLKSHPDFSKRIERIAANEKNSAAATKDFSKQIATWTKEYETAVSLSDKQSVGDVDDTNWKKIQAPGYWEGQGFRNYDGIAWYRKSVELPDNLVGERLQLSLGMIDDKDRTFVNGKLVGATNGYRKPRNYQVPADLNNQKSLTISVQVHDTGGAGGFHGNPSQMKLLHESEESISISGPWKIKKSDLIAKLSPRPRAPGFNGPNNPTALYNAMVSPLIPIGFKGAIWYQGESNAGRAHQYRTLFPLLINDWRSKWDRELPFYWVQLANFRQAVGAPRESGWAELREAQSMTLNLPSTGEAVIIDIGDARDIHPKNKQDVGKRLALIALKHNYDTDVGYSGPRYREMKIEGNRIRLSFEHAGGLKTSDNKPLSQFAISGANQTFVWATAVIEGDDVIVSADQVKEPIAVRYAWANNPEGCNLTNKYNLPASPFRTDDWPGMTVGNK